MRWLHIFERDWDMVSMPRVLYLTLSRVETNVAIVPQGATLGSGYQTPSAWVDRELFARSRS